MYIDYLKQTGVENIQIIAVNLEELENADLLSGELATLLSGKYIQIDMLPFSFRENYEATKESGKSKKEIFDSYLRYGSFPYVAYLENDEKVINQYTEGIYNLS